MTSEMSNSERFTEACGFVIPFGKHEGKTIARIGASKEGLLYLDWLIGQKWLKEPLLSALNDYLSHPAISHQIASYLE
jgi:hypothetical protein